MPWTPTPTPTAGATPTSHTGYLTHRPPEPGHLRPSRHSRTCGHRLSGQEAPARPEPGPTPCAETGRHLGAQPAGLSTGLSSNRKGGRETSGGFPGCDPPDLQQEGKHPILAPPQGRYPSAATIAETRTPVGGLQVCKLHLSHVINAVKVIC